MPTKPIEIILSKSIEPKEFQEFITLISATLDEIVSYGTQVIHWAAHNPKFDEPYLDLPVLLLTRHIVELADSISILVKQSSIDPCKILLRSALETMLYIKFIAEQKSKDRCIAYMHNYIINKKNEYSRFKRGTKLHNEFQGIIKNDQLIMDGFNPFSKDLDDQLQKKIENLDRLILKPIFTVTKKEFNRIKKKLNRRPPWYSLYNGASNIAKLADLLKHRYLYEVVYRKWSNSVHASDVISGKIAKAEDGKSSFYSLRSALDVNYVATIAITIFLNTYRTLVNFIVPEMSKNYDNWYEKEIQDAFNKIIKTKIKFSE